MLQRRCYNFSQIREWGGNSFEQGLDGFITGTKSTEQCDENK